MKPLRRLLVVPAMLVACAVSAPVAWADTDLRLAETATVMAAPDEIAAALRAEAISPSASDAQAKVNAAIQDAVAQARKVTGITVSTGGYTVWRTGPSSADHAERWQASQTLNLSAHDAPALLTLTGALQQRGLVVGGLGWRLSRTAERTARQEATKQALTALRGRVDEAAALLDLKFSQFKTVRLDSAGEPPMPRGLPMAMAASASAPAPPTAAPEDVPVSATADADAILVPR
jgi:predicted secreted protein